VSAAAPEPDDAASAFAATCAALGDDLGWALGALFRSYRDTAKRAFGDLPGGSRGYQVLMFAAVETPATQLALAQRLGIDRTVMTYLLDDLERAGLVERRPDPADRRARRVVATDGGRARLAEIDERLRQVEAEVLTPLSAPEAAAFRGMLQRLTTQADRESVGAACARAESLEDESPAGSRRTRRAR
jgi:DNA-binding MarR family transcriptional regulator